MPAYTGSTFVGSRTKETNASPALPASVYDLLPGNETAVIDTDSSVTSNSTTQASQIITPYAATAAAAGGAIGAAPLTTTAKGWRMRGTTDLTAADPNADRLLTPVVNTLDFNIIIRTGTYALLAANPNYQLTVVAYLVTPANVITEVFRATSAAKAVAATTATDITINAVVPPTVVIPRGGSLQFEAYLTFAATANALNQVTNNTVTILSATGSYGLFVQVNGGLRFRYSRASSDTTMLSEAPSRLVTRGRSTTESIPTTESPKRTVSQSRSASETIPTTETPSRKLTYGRSTAEYPPGVDPDYLVQFPTKAISGLVIDHETGNRITVACTVELFRDRDNKHVQTLTPAASATGAFSFPRDLYDPNTYYYVARYTDAQGKQVHGISDRGQVPA